MLEVYPGAKRKLTMKPQRLIAETGGSLWKNGGSTWSLRLSSWSYKGSTWIF
jgi:hypothetical protein